MRARALQYIHYTRYILEIEIRKSIHMAVPPAEGTFTFDNGVTLARQHLHRSQLKRYRSQQAVRLHEPHEEFWFDLLLFNASQSDVFLNIGAAAGYYALAALRLRPGLRVVAVNPHPSFQAMLRANAAYAGLNVTDGSLASMMPIAGSVLQLPYALSARESSWLLGDGWGDGLQRTLAAKTLASGHSRGGRPHSPARVRSVHLHHLTNLTGEVYMANFDIQGHERGVFEADGTHRVLSTHILSRVIVGTHGCDFGTRVVRCADLGPRAFARHGCHVNRSGETMLLGKLLRNSSECGIAHATVLNALRRAQYRILYEAAHVEGQPDGLIVAISPLVQIPPFLMHTS